jgi:hypothetical protein
MMKSVFLQSFLSHMFSRWHELVDVAITVGAPNFAVRTKSDTFGVATYAFETLPADGVSPVQVQHKRPNCRTQISRVQIEILRIRSPTILQRSCRGAGVRHEQVGRR